MPAPPGIHVVDDPAAPSAAETPVGAPPAPLVVIVHGAMDRSSSFGRVAKQLSHLHVVRYDRRGYGRSAGARLGSLHDHVDDLLAIIDDRPAVVFGHSIGGVIALYAAAEAPELVRSVLAYEPPTPWAPWWPESPAPPADAEEEAEAFMRRAIGDRFWSRLPARTRADRRAEGPALRADVASLDGPRPFDPAIVGSPVIVAAGEEASWWHARAASELAAELPRAEHEIVAGAQHGVHLTHPKATAHLIDRALDRADGHPRPSH